MLQAIRRQYEKYAHRPEALHLSEVGVEASLDDTACWIRSIVGTLHRYQMPLRHIWSAASVACWFLRRHDLETRAC